MGRPLMAPPAPNPPAPDVPVRSLAARVRTLNVGRTVVAILGGGWMALFLAVTLGRLRLDVAASIAALSLVLVLLFITAWDLLVRWGPLRRRPILVGAGPQDRARRWLRWVGATMVLVAGILIGHGLWR